ncbi:MAG: WecB/TagA/CpsF family glycosyltransferase [Ezakiella sp.]|nr:WecB/TagA/CpsF family glycosyltransferase [Ezakiella sp.]MDD7472230.1 WecB/TagA/CpsF family glycosyltransferase [Bacillota bacterium]MDY3923223.1 WecB/TagA/CpsF family glycosyltransferase [Ezakiella sp.]
METVNVLGVKFSNVSAEMLETVLREAVSGEKNVRIVTPNPEIVMAAHKDAELMELINSSDLVLKDGVGIKIAEKLKHVEGFERQTGIATLEKILSIADELRLKVYFVGAKEATLFKAVDKIKEKYPNLEVVGMHDGYFKENSEEETKIIADINKKKPDILVAAMGFPKQEKFLALTETPKISIGCGGSLDVISGNVKRAPKWMQKAGFEWFYRLIKEPKRIKRQMVIPLFLAKIIFNKKSCFKEG